ncbi:PepSY domain-containing protein [Cognaticolwellia aestuarii]|uniref:PepSY domain-containing protein n=1 Tax=Cognaticolwellia aestuarii TaxID=329993 RepID=UPI001F29F39B|nr:hypothetical protein [Cognaticolwellia aestuarii]
MMQWVKKIHKWVSLLIGLQVFIWVLSGLIFNVIDHNKARGNAYRQAISTKQNIIAEKDLLPVESILAAYPDTIELSQTTLLSKPYYLLTKEQALYQHFANTYQLVNAISGELTIVDKQLATDIAKASYNGPGNITSTTLLTGNIADFTKQKNPSWQVNFSDKLQTSVYVEQGSGRLVGHSNSDKRFANFFFMLHFMDYNHEGSFNNVQIIFFAFVTLWLTLSGLVWAIHLLRLGKYHKKYI